MESLEIYQDEIDNALDKYRGDKKPEEPKMQTKQPTNKSKRNPKKTKQYVRTVYYPSQHSI